MPAKQKTFYSTHQLAIACEIMEQAKQPILYVGGGMSGTVSELRNFIAISGLPTVSTLKGLGAVTADDPHYLGMVTNSNLTLKKTAPFGAGFLWNLAS